MASNRRSLSRGKQQLRRSIFRNNSAKCFDHGRKVSLVNTSGKIRHLNFEYVSGNLPGPHSQESCIVCRLGGFILGKEFLRHLVAWPKARKRDGNIFSRFGSVVLYQFSRNL